MLSNRLGVVILLALFLPPHRPPPPAPVSYSFLSFSGKTLGLASSPPARARSLPMSFQGPRQASPASPMVVSPRPGLADWTIRNAVRRLVYAAPHGPSWAPWAPAGGVSGALKAMVLLQWLLFGGGQWESGSGYSIRGRHFQALDSGAFHSHWGGGGDGGYWESSFPLMDTVMASPPG